MNPGRHFLCPAAPASIDLTHGERTPKHLLQPGNAAQHIVAGSERIRAELRYEKPVDIHEAMSRTIAWEQNNPPSTINPQQFDYDAEDAALANRV